MEKHYGQIVEYSLRKKGFNISGLAKLLKVNRRTIYNWFNQRYLKADLILRIGLVAKIDFSVQFPELFTPAQFNLKHDSGLLDSTLPNNRWKDRYLLLLEKYNKVLSNALKTSEKGKIFMLLTVAYELAA